MNENRRVLWEIVLGGPPGGGKGVQGQLLTAKLAEREIEVYRIGTGDKLNKLVAKKCENWQVLERAIKSGELVPDEFFIPVLRGEIGSIPDHCRFVLYDGALRKHSHVVEYLRSKRERLDRGIQVRTIFFDLVFSPEGVEACKARIIRAAKEDPSRQNRLDNNLGVIETRFAVFREHYPRAQQMLGFSCDRLKNLSGTESIQVIHAEIMKTLAEECGTD